MKYLYLVSLLFIFGCQEENKCESAPNLISIEEEADFVYEGDFNVEGYPTGTVKIEVWDCVDASWWGPVDEQKIVLVFSNPNSCGFEDVEQLTFDCDEENGPDRYVRDEDGDGLVRSEDCDDTDENIGVCDEETVDESVE